MRMLCSPRGTVLIQDFEELRLAAYVDAVGVWTVGWGHTRGVAPYPHLITMATAKALFAEDLATAEAGVNSLVVAHRDLHQLQFDALCSFTFNLGVDALGKSTLRRLLLEGKDHAAADELDRWVYGKGRRLDGLVRRRAAEKALFVEGMAA